MVNYNCWKLSKLKQTFWYSTSMSNSTLWLAELFSLNLFDEFMLPQSILFKYAVKYFNITLVINLLCADFCNI